jgi:hypothetical protein
MVPELSVVFFTLLSYPLGLTVGSRWLLPLLNAAPAYLVMVTFLRRGERGRAVRTMLLWAATLAIVSTVSFRLWPTAAESTVLNGAAYREEMFHWIRTGEGTEGRLQLFLPQHLLHLGAFVILSLLSGSVLSVLMGAVLMNYMGFYVASLSRAGVPLATVLLFGWQPYALVRIAAFSTLGAILAEPLLSRVLRYPYPGLAASRRYFMWALGGLVLDWVLKTAIAPTWGMALRASLR